MIGDRDGNLPKCVNCNESLKRGTNKTRSVKVVKCTDCKRVRKKNDISWHCDKCNLNICKNCLDRDAKDTKYNFCCCTFSKNYKTCCNLGSCVITKYFIFLISMLMGLGLHITDLGTDIIVLVDLYTKQIEYFYTSLGILLLSSFGTFIVSISFFSDKNTDFSKNLGTRYRRQITVEPVETIEPVETVETVETVEPVETVETVEPVVKKIKLL